MCLEVCAPRGELVGGTARLNLVNTTSKEIDEGPFVMERPCWPFASEPLSSTTSTKSLPAMRSFSGSAQKLL